MDDRQPAECNTTGAPQSKVRCEALTPATHCANGAHCIEFMLRRAALAEGGGGCHTYLRSWWWQERGDSPVTLRTSWEFRRCRKYASHATVHVIPPEETIARVTPLLETIGVTRVAEVTGLDRVGILCSPTVRPRETGDGISYYDGTA